MSDDVPMVYYWQGRNIEELNKEELIDALKDAIKQIQWERDFHKMDREMMEIFARVREREFSIKQLEVFQKQSNHLAQMLGLT